MLTARLAAAEEPAPEPRSRTTAFALSAGATALSLGLVVSGWRSDSGTLLVAGALSSLVAPSAGHVYAGEPLVAWGLGIRLMSAGVAAIGFGRLLTGFSDSSQRDDGAGLVITGMIGYGVGIIYDIATTGRAVDRYNERLRLRVTPLVTPTAASSNAVGVGISGSF